MTRSNDKRVKQNIPEDDPRADKRQGDPAAAPRDAPQAERTAADERLLQAVLAPRRPGAIRQIADACAAGADPNGLIPEACDAPGPVRVGSTLLTQAIQDDALRAVEQLLEQGASPNLADDNGWTPWMASTLAAESKRARIQALLLEHGADRDGEHIGELARAIYAGDLDRAAAAIDLHSDLHILAGYRVDLLGHQILHANLDMLEWLLEQGMPCDSAHLISAIRSDDLQAVDQLLRHGVAPEQQSDNQTPLMLAAGMGALAIVQRLVEAGADVNRGMCGNIEWTAAFAARSAGYPDVADWLSLRMDTTLLEQQRRIMQTRNPKFRALYQQATASEYGTGRTSLRMDTTLLEQQRRIMQTRNPKFRALYQQATASEYRSTDELVGLLEQWDQRYGIQVRDVSRQSLDLELATVPEDMDAFLAELIDLCPDLVESRAALRKAVQKKRVLHLWWD
jgi:hypothetical protein